MAAKSAEDKGNPASNKRAKPDDTEFSQKFSSSLADMFSELLMTSHSFQKYDVKSTPNFPEQNAELTQKKLEAEHVDITQLM